MTPDADLLLHARLLLLVGIANGGPLLGTAVLRQRCNWPLDLNARFFDGRPVFGPSKTWRGIAFALIVTPLAAALLDLEVWVGLVIGACAMLGDVLSSFTKRRLGLPSSSQAIGIDQIPESALPLLAVSRHYELNGMEVAAMVAAFVVAELLLSRVLFKLRLRDQPY